MPKVRFLDSAVQLEAARISKFTRKVGRHRMSVAVERRDCSEVGRIDMNMLWFLIVGLVAGWLAGVVVKGGGFGVVGDIVVGVVGALLGGWLFGRMGVSAGGGLLGSIVVATIGAVLLIFILRLIKRA
jgi:uncharacterized membrane protein YeaQ/YmgE (transglycosylase-associated protein family)